MKIDAMIIACLVLNLFICVSSRLTKINQNYKTIKYYAYYLDDKKLIACSDKKFINQEQLGTNEFQIKDGYSCLLDLKESGFYKIKLFIIDVTDKKVRDAQSSYNPALKLDLADTLIDKRIFIKDFLKMSFFIDFRMPDKLSYLSAKDYYACKVATSTTPCNFIKLKSGPFLDKFLQFNFRVLHAYELMTDQEYESVNNNDIYKDFLLDSSSPNQRRILLQQAAKASPKGLNCEPACKKGVCFSDSCHCIFGYMGEDCSVKMKSSGFRIPLWLLILFFVVAVGIGVLVAWLIFYCIKKCIGTQQGVKNTRDREIAVRWERKDDK